MCVRVCVCVPDGQSLCISFCVCVCATQDDAAGPSADLGYDDEEEEEEDDYEEGEVGELIRASTLMDDLG